MKHTSIVVYFSHSGNTRMIAEEIAKQTNANIFEIIPDNTYPEEYRKCTDLAAIEKKKNARPTMALNIENLENYDTIYLGFPNWWSTAPMIIFSFLEQHDVTTKKIIPFLTHGGGGVADCVKDLKKAIGKQGVIENPLVIFDRDIHNRSHLVKDWLQQEEI